MLPPALDIDRNHSSPNYSARPLGLPVSIIVLHADADSEVEHSLAWCCSRQSKVSYHYLIGRTGRVYELVSPIYSAWAVGVSRMPDLPSAARYGPSGNPSINGSSISISFGNRNDEKEPFTELELDAGARLVVELRRMRGFVLPIENITTHKAVAVFPIGHPKAGQVGRKTDPDALFDLQAFKNRVRQIESGLWQPPLVSPTPSE